MKKFTHVTPTEEQRIVTKAKAGDESTYWAPDPDFAFKIQDREDGIPPGERFAAFMNYESETPSMQPVEHALMQRMLRHTDDTLNGKQNNVLLVMTEPGAGKTRLHRKMVEATGFDSILLTPDDNIDSDEFLVRSSLNPENGTNLITKINEALNGKVSMNADALKQLETLLDKNNYLYDAEHDERGADGKSTTIKSRAIDVSKLDSDDRIETLKSIAETVGLTSGKMSKPLVSMGAGALLPKLIHARDTGEPLLITFDEGNYYNWGPISRNLLAVLGGHDDECTIPHYKPDGSLVQEKFTRKQLEQVYALITTNMAGPNEPNPKPFAESVLSRIQPVPFKVKYGADDFAARISKEFLGFPLTTHWDADPTYFAQNEDKALKHFSNILTGGITEAEAKGRNNAQQTRLLAKAGDAYLGCKLYGSALAELKDLCNGEVDKSLKRELDKYLETAGTDIHPKMDGRTLATLKNYADKEIHNSPKDRKTGEYPYRLSPDMRKHGTHAVENLGTRMTNALLYWIDNNFPTDKGLDNIRAHIGEMLVQKRIISTEYAKKHFLPTGSELRENEPAGEKVAELLNVGATLGRAEELEAAQSLLHSIAIRKFGGQYTGSQPDQLFNIDAVASMLDEYNNEAKKIKSEAPEKNMEFGVLVPELVQTEDKKGFALRIGRSETRKGNDKAVSNLEKMPLEQQLMAIITNKDDDLSHLFVAKPLSAGVEAEISKKQETLQQALQEFLAINEQNEHANDVQKAENKKRLETEYAQRIARVREGYEERLQSLSAGTHPAGIHITNLALAVKGDDGRPAGFTLLRDVSPAKNGEPQEPAKYVLIGEQALSDSVMKYLNKIHIDYIDISKNEGKEALGQRLSNLISIGARRILDGVEEAHAKLPPLDDEEKQAARLGQMKYDAIERYSKAWDAVMIGGEASQLFTLGRPTKEHPEWPDRYQELIGKPISKETMDRIQAATSDDEKRELLEAAQAGVQQLALFQNPEKPHYERLIDKIAATAAFTITHGDYQEKNIVMPIAPQSHAMARI